MIFKWINVAYFAIWTFNLLTVYNAKKLDDYDISKELRFALKYHPFLLIIISIVIMFITCYLSIDTTRTIMGIYFVVTFIDFKITSWVVFLFGFGKDSKGVSQTVRGTVWVAPRSRPQRKRRGAPYGVA